MILRALRPEFPEALFFTTDFDEAFTMQMELPWTRNLIISSSFGPKLSAEFQGEIPPFREPRQTSVFLSTQLAVSDTLKDDFTSNKLRAEVAVPRIFEIERSGHPLPLVGFAPRDANSIRGDCPGAEFCDDIPQVMNGVAKYLEKMLGFLRPRCSGGYRQ